MSRRVDDEEWAALKRALRQRIDARAATAARRRGTLGPTSDERGSKG